MLYVKDYVLPMFKRQQNYELKMDGVSFLVSCTTFWVFRNIIGNEWKRIYVECDSLFRFAELFCCWQR